MKDSFTTATARRLRDVALALPETSEGTSCVNRAFKVRKKNFLFLGEKKEGVRVMLKLGPSLDQASAMGKSVSVGKTGWVTVLAAEQDLPDGAVLDAWIEESFRLLAPKTVVAELA